MESIVLTGERVRLEPLGDEHVTALVAAAAQERAIYRWSFVPEGPQEMQRYVARAVRERADGTALPFAIIRRADGRAVGSTRFFNFEWWTWPAGHARAGRVHPDAAEIGYTWLAASALRTGINREAKHLMLAHAFAAWDALRICFHTDARNERSARALERLGARFEGVLRAHRLGTDLAPRDSKRYSILATEFHGHASASPAASNESSAAARIS